MPSEAHQTIANMLRQNLMLGGGDGELDVQAIRQGMEAMTASGFHERLRLCRSPLRQIRNGTSASM